MPNGFCNGPGSILPRMVCLSAGVVVVVGSTYAFAEWCEDLLISHRLQQRLRLMRTLQVSGADLSRTEWTDPGHDAVARRIWREPLFRYRVAVREPVYGLRLELIRWHGLTETWRVGCLHSETGEIAVQKNGHSPVPVVCEGVAQEF